MCYSDLLNLYNIFYLSKIKRFSLVKIKFFKKYFVILSVLLKEGFIRGFFIGYFRNFRVIYILLKRTNDYTLKLNKLQTNYQVGFSYNFLKKTFSSFNTSILLTNKGILSDMKAIDLKIGGSNIMYIY